MDSPLCWHALGVFNLIMLVKIKTFCSIVCILIYLHIHELDFEFEMTLVCRCVLYFFG